MSKFKKAYKTKWKYVFCMIPSLFFFTLFCIYPNLSVFPLALYKWSPIKTVKEYVGFQNFKMLFVINQDQTMKFLVNTVTYVLLLFVIQTTLALILALALEKNSKVNIFFRTYFFLPKMFSVAMVGLTWQFMYDPNIGIINHILAALGVEGYPGTYLFQGNFISVLLVVIVHIWMNLGYPIMFFLSGLSSIPGELNEAAKVDGANSWQIFWSIKIPLLLPTLTRISLLTLTTGTMAADFTVIVGAAANGQADTLASNIYSQTLLGTSYGMVSAYGVLMFFILAAASIIQFVGLRKIENKVLG